MKRTKTFLATFILTSAFSLPRLMAMASRSTDPNAPPPPMWVSLVPFVFMIGIFYFFLIRPQSKQKNIHQQIIDSLKKGDKIVTTGGLIGTIVNITPTTAEIKLNDDVKVRVIRSAVTDLYVEPSNSIEKDVVTTNS